MPQPPNPVFGITVPCHGLHGEVGMHTVLIDETGAVHTPDHHHERWADDRSIARALNASVPWDTCEYWRWVGQVYHHSSASAGVWRDGTLSRRAGVDGTPMRELHGLDHDPFAAFTPFTDPQWRFSQLADSAPTQAVEVLWSGLGVTTDTPLDLERPQRLNQPSSLRAFLAAPLDAIPYLAEIHHRHSMAIPLTRIAELAYDAHLTPQQVRTWVAAGVPPMQLAAWLQLGATLDTAATLTRQRINQHGYALANAAHWTEHDLDVNDLPAFLRVCPAWTGPHPKAPKPEDSTFNVRVARVLVTTARQADTAPFAWNPTWTTYLALLTPFVLRAIPTMSADEIAAAYLATLHRHGNPLAWPDDFVAHLRKAVQP